MASSNTGFERQLRGPSQGYRFYHRLTLLDQTQHQKLSIYSTVLNSPGNREPYRSLIKPCNKYYTSPGEQVYAIPGLCRVRSWCLIRRNLEMYQDSIYSYILLRKFRQYLSIELKPHILLLVVRCLNSLFSGMEIVTDIAARCNILMRAKDFLENWRRLI